jgi:hypothetical protein
MAIKRLAGNMRQVAWLQCKNCRATTGNFSMDAIELLIRTTVAGGWRLYDDTGHDHVLCPACNRALTAIEAKFHEQGVLPPYRHHA